MRCGGINNRVAAAVLAMGLASGTAQGALYVGEWDPPFDRGSPLFGDTGVGFERLGWRGSVAVSVSDGCGTVGTVYVSGPCTAQVTELKVDLYQYDLLNPGGPGGPTLATVSFTDLDSVAVNQLRFLGGVLSEIDTGVFGPNNAAVVAALPGSVDPYFAEEYDWYIRFIIDLDVDDYDPFELFFPEGDGFGEARYGAGSPVTTLSAPTLFSGPVLANYSDAGWFGFSNLQEFWPALRFTVPVPGTLLLALAALAALGATRRR